MKRVFRRLACCSFLGIASIGYFDVEARVTKEVAEAVLPYLMKAAGITEDTRPTPDPTPNVPYYIQAKRDAIISMIYTDAGQQQMVEWAVQDQKPDILAGDEGAFKDGWPATSANTNNGNERLFQILFPCKTGTFTSFANHASRFGHAVLTKYESVKDQLSQWIIDGVKPVHGGKDIVAVGNAALDCKIARIIFILDIFDDFQQIYEVCVENFRKARLSKEFSSTMASDLASLYKETIFSVAKLIDPGLDNEKIKKILDHRFSIALEKKKKPSKTDLSDATALCRKVISDKQVEQIFADIRAYSKQLMAATSELIATQEYACRPVSATVAHKDGDCVETLYRHLINIAIQDTTKLHLLHTERLPACIRRYFGDKTPKVIKGKSFSGETSIKDHNKWKNALQSVADFKTYFNISSGGVYNIARTLWQIAFFHETKQAESFVGSENFAEIIAKAMNKLANSSQRFSVTISNSENDKGWITQRITVHDKSLTRTIVIGICEDISNDNFGHAEIISIKKDEQRY